MKILILLFLLFISVGCNTRPKEKTSNGGVEHPKPFLYPPGHHLTDCFFGGDTVILIKRQKLADSSSLEKREFVGMVLNQLHKEDTSFNRLYDLNDFSLNDLDLDGYLDLIYTPSSNNFARNEFNFSLLCRNRVDSFQIVRLKGLIEKIERLPDGELLINTITYPCCDFHNFIFHSNHIAVPSWTCSSNPLIEVHKSKVKHL